MLTGGFGFTVEQRRDRTSLRFTIAIGTMKYAWTIVPGTELAENIGL
jgi:hypothetical protein